MKISPKAVDGFLRNKPDGYIAALIYGPDHGLALERATRIASLIAPQDDPFSSVTLDASQVKDDEAALLDRMSGIPFGGGRMLVRIKDADNSVTSPLRAAVEMHDKSGAQPSEMGFLLMVAGDLTPASSLRKFAESHKLIACVACYHDDAAHLATITAGMLSRLGVQASNDALQYIAHACQGDRLVIRQAVSKIALYLDALPAKGEDAPRREHHLSLDAARMLCPETTDASYSDICAAVADKNPRAITHALNKAWNQGESPVTVLRALQRYFTRILEAYANMRKGMDARTAAGALRPPVFFKEMPDFVRHVNIWTDGGTHDSKLRHMLETIYKAEISCKLDASKFSQIFTQFLLTTNKFNFK